MYLKRNISSELITYKGIDFGRVFKKQSRKRYEVTIGVGGNIGDVRRRLKHLLVYFQKDKRIDVMQSSFILKNPPFGFLDQEDFFNAVYVMRVDMQPLQFLDYLMRVEKKFSRKRTFLNAPRTLDLDIIFFDNRIVEKKNLVIPHKNWNQRSSVIIPLAGLK